MPIDKAPEFLIGQVILEYGNEVPCVLDSGSAAVAKGDMVKVAGGPVFAAATYPKLVNVTAVTAGSDLPFGVAMKAASPGDRFGVLVKGVTKSNPVYGTITAGQPVGPCTHSPATPYAQQRVETKTSTAMYTAILGYALDSGSSGDNILILIG